MIDEAYVRKLLWHKLESTGRTQTSLAQELDCSITYVNDVLHGHRPTSDKILSWLGLKWEIVPANGKE